VSRTDIARLSPAASHAQLIDLLLNSGHRRTGRHKCRRWVTDKIPDGLPAGDIAKRPGASGCVVAKDESRPVTETGAFARHSLPRFRS
jgi:hypothetical protein